MQLRRGRERLESRISPCRHSTLSARVTERVQQAACLDERLLDFLSWIGECRHGATHADRGRRIGRDDGANDDGEIGATAEREVTEYAGVDAAGPSLEAVDDLHRA